MKYYSYASALLMNSTRINSNPPAVLILVLSTIVSYSVPKITLLPTIAMLSTYWH